MFLNFAPIAATKNRYFQPRFTMRSLSYDYCYNHNVQCAENAIHRCTFECNTDTNTHQMQSGWMLELILYWNRYDIPACSDTSTRRPWPFPHILSPRVNKSVPVDHPPGTSVFAQTAVNSFYISISLYFRPSLMDKSHPYPTISPAPHIRILTERWVAERYREIIHFANSYYCYCYYCSHSIYRANMRARSHTSTRMAIQSIIDSEPPSQPLIPTARCIHALLTPAPIPIPGFATPHCTSHAVRLFNSARIQVVVSLDGTATTSRLSRCPVVVVVAAECSPVFYVN